MSTLIRVKNLGKAYRVYASEWLRFARWFGIKTQSKEEVWTLKNVSFEIQSGQAIGIVGQNGAGKSTLLKILAGTLQSTEGSVQVNARIAAILELGMGFNPELTGRQNVVYAAGLMGFSPTQIRAVMPEIEAFAEIGDYFDEPVRSYSSGMRVRVAFSVATAYRPEILIIDEALSVGDVYFKHKSFSRIREFQEQGTTLLIVSHDRSAIQTLCDRAILLEKGRVIKDAKPEEVFDYYNAIIAEKENSKIDVKKRDDGLVETSSGTGEATVTEIFLYNAKGDAVDHVEVGEPLALHVTVKIHKAIDGLVFGYGIKDRLGQVMYGTNTFYTEQVIRQPKVGEEYKLVIAFDANFGVGSYSVQTALTDENNTHLSANYEWRDLALLFSVMNVDKTHFVGCSWNEPRITITSNT